MDVFVSASKSETKKIRFIGHIRHLCFSFLHWKQRKYVSLVFFFSASGSGTKEIQKGKPREPIIDMETLFVFHSFKARMESINSGHLEGIHLESLVNNSNIHKLAAEVFIG